MVGITGKRKDTSKVKEHEAERCVPAVATDKTAEVCAWQGWRQPVARKSGRGQGREKFMS